MEAILETATELQRQQQQQKQPKKPIKQTARGG